MFVRVLVGLLASVNLLAADRTPNGSKVIIVDPRADARAAGGPPAAADSLSTSSKAASGMGTAPKLIPTLRQRTWPQPVTNTSPPYSGWQKFGKHQNETTSSPSTTRVASASAVREQF